MPVDASSEGVRADGSSGPPAPPSRWAPGQVALIAAAVILVVVVGATLLGQAGVLPESATAALNALFLAVCGAVAGLIGAGRRRAQRWPEAVVAYRVAMWCFFLAALHAVKYHVAAEREALAAIAREASEKHERLRPGDTGPVREP
jgi:hypothetical protein